MSFVVGLANVIGKLEKMFAQHGITMTYNGKQVSRDEAWKHINAQFNA